ncbi:polysaccharide biosynthesis protein [Paucibacter sp. DJ2R-2]|uniref:polysaccharide biosynthesis protein n=1 Tax=Paucibacter sp. DJ2R-2 TaxID=2893558 RepID=UPI0021E3CE41|nr:nucleoside-diphosphate sugar epimerase/dehydratase [Paucibacter sp. DJ2R-2]MCV2420409.1 polysaccharide biosynthesis protein [Paucibacter sp. DJ4R-1]MCV2441432.1 polysaccharide biosynthesis protein [Paucibacter sp. DJ2R-2]
MFWLTLDTFLTRIRPFRAGISLLLDAVLVALAWHATYLFRLGFEKWWSARPSYDTAVLAGLVLLYALMLWLWGAPRGMWRFSGFGEVKRLAGACLMAGLLGAVAVLMAHLSGVPRSVLALHPVFCLISMAMMRLGYRMLYEHMRGRISGSSVESHRALVMGAGQAGRLAVAGIQHQGWVVVGWLDDDPLKRDVRVAGIPVLGPLDQLARFVALHGITHVIVAMPSAEPAQRRRALALASSSGLNVLTVPSNTELLSGRRVEQLRHIEPEDLLGREPVQLDEGGISECLNGRTVLITGAGGSIGSELCRQVARYGPKKLVLYEQSEFALYQIEQDLTLHFPLVQLVRLMGDVKDLDHLRQTFQRFKPQVTFHAAAYKHVPLMEDENAWAAVRNNTLGTYHAALAAAESGVERFVLISTDKAVNPTNVMGASKRAAELVLSHMASVHAGTRFMAVRFGNVLGSSGSVIPKFKEQIARGGPVTVTHPDITRYFMTIPEAARLVVQAAAIGETGRVYVLDMGDPVRIVDLARDMIRLSGHRTDEVLIQFSGLRPGEKLFEELLTASETTLPTTIQRLNIACLQDSPKDDQVLRWLFELCAMGAVPDETVRRALRSLLPEFSPSLH